MATDNITPIRPAPPAPPKDDDKGPSSFDVSHEILSARAILECYIDTIPDERADDRFVLWTVRDKLNEALDLCEHLP